MSNTWWKDVDELVKEQADLLDIPTGNSLLIKGPPGSGKTNLLLLRANQLYLGDRPNLHVVVFGSLLSQFIQLGGLQYKFPPEKVITHTRLFSSVLREHGADIDSTGMKIEVARSLRAHKLKELLDSGKAGAQYQALLLDEAQDYSPLEIRLLRQLTEILVATADSRQKIYEVDDCESTLKECTGAEYVLKFHFRNGLEICRLADGLVRGLPNYIPLIQHSNYDEKAYPSKVAAKMGLSLVQQAEAMAAQISDQRVAYPNELIGILCPRNEELIIIGQELAKAGLGGEVTRANAIGFDPSRPIWLSTLTAAKGLEFRAVHIAGLDFLHRMGGVQKRLIYTGVTRAKSALTLYWDHSIPGYLEMALQPFLPAKTAISKQNLFGKS
jgi:superfamily I DNA/RNA helicase